MTTSTATTASVSPGEYDGTIYDAKLDGAAVYDATDDDARVHTDAYDAVADDGPITAGDGTKYNRIQWHSSSNQAGSKRASHSIMLDAE